MIDDIIQEATEAEEQGREAGYAVGKLLRIISQQNAEIRELKRKEMVDGKSDVEKIALKYFSREEELERQKLEIDILIRKKDTLRDEIAEKDAEIERLQKIIVGFMDEVGTWSNKYDVDVSNIHRLPLLAKEDFNIRNKIKSEAYREFAERLKQTSKEVTVPYVADTSIHEHKTGMFWYTADDLDNLLKELTEKNDKG